MVDLILWKRLTRNDINAIHGRAAPRGGGGGARHIALGVQNRKFAIQRFLKNAGPNRGIRTEEVAGQYPAGNLLLGSNPDRRGGEWIIRDQSAHRHPAWSSASGFPTVHDPKNRTYIVVARLAGKFHARFTMEGNLAALSPEMRKMLRRPKGIEPLNPELIQFLNLPAATLFEIFEEAAADYEERDAFDPNDLEDGRRRILTSVLQRQGQQAFRKALLKAYAERCAVTDCAATWVLEAAHIVPYRGERTNRTANGLLLRADVHTLFDIGLLSVEPESGRIVVSSLLSASEYAEFAGKALAMPTVKAHRPSKAALKGHFSRFRN